MRHSLAAIARHAATRRGLVAVLLGAFAFDATAADYTLERVVLVSRHGVRSPTNSDQLAKYSATRTWPSWPVKDGCLTPHGKIAASRMGAFYRRLYAARGLFPARSGPAANEVYVWADVDQRTRETGVGLLRGLFACEGGASCPSPHCLTCGPVGEAEECAPKANDVLFHPVRGQGACKFAPGAQDELRGLLKKAQARPDYGKAVQDLQAVLSCCQPELCAARGVVCTLGAVPSSVDVTDHSATLKGPISIGSTASEVFLLEYAQRMAHKDVAWGLASTPDRIVRLMKLHGVQFDLMQRTRVLARAQGSALLNQVLETLRQTAEGKSDPLRPIPSEARLVIYVGHDTNLANIGGMLTLNWQLGKYLENETPPAGAMAFELWRDMRSREYVVRLAYYSQTPEQMRKLAQLRLRSISGAKPDTPDIARISIGHLCTGAQGADGACPWAGFYAAARQTRDTDCLGDKNP
jgi:4-phytase / acid phosphatase